jgi:hypothetical protein
MLSGEQSERIEHAERTKGRAPPISRVADVSINTVAKLLADAGGTCADFHDAKLRRVKARRIQVDES